MGVTGVGAPGAWAIGTARPTVTPCWCERWWGVHARVDRDDRSEGAVPEGPVDPDGPSPGTVTEITPGGIAEVMNGCTCGGVESVAVPTVALARSRTGVSAPVTGPGVAVLGAGFTTAAVGVSVGAWWDGVIGTTAAGVAPAAWPGEVGRVGRVSAPAGRANASERTTPAASPRAPPQSATTIG
jgi:hypothetical protein